MQRLNTSKVANVGAKAKVWPDKQCRRAVLLSGAELVGSGKYRSRGEGGGIDATIDQAMACTGEETA
jgi:hypothetical protein